MVPQQVKFATGVTASIVPFSRNLSTILDFVLLNPLVIFFLQRSRTQWREVNRQLSLPRGFSAYHRVGISIICFAFGVGAMKFYVEGSPFYDATLVPGVVGGMKVTVTGWIVYSWTAIYIGWLLFVAIEHGRHVARLMVLPASAVPYSPFHPDGAAGIQFLMEPSLSAGYAMIGLLATFIVFVVHDKVLYHIESNRLLGFGLYVVVALTLFGFPFWKLHQIMKVRRNEYLFDSLDQTLADARLASNRKDWTALAGCVAAIESADKYRKLVSTFPVWPVPLALALPSLSSTVAALIPLVQKIILAPSQPG